jgi:hypothetical protein
MRPYISPRSLILLPGLAALCLAAAPEVDAPHAANDVYQALLRDGLTLAGSRIAFPAPLVTEGDTPDAERAALRKLAGSDDAVQELLRNSVTAPQILRLHDEKAGDGTMIRIAHLWFAVHARLEEIDAAPLGGRDEDGKPVEAGNMRFSGRRLSDEELNQRGITRLDPKLEWYSHVAGDLLDRIQVEATDHIRGTKGPGSWVFASRTDPRFDEDRPYPNRWRTVGPKGQSQESAGFRHYAGGGSTTRITRLASMPGALLVEGHFAFAEPRAWFDGAPILRSKISLVAQDQIRRFRRELAQSRSGKGR